MWPMDLFLIIHLKSGFESLVESMKVLGYGQIYWLRTSVKIILFPIYNASGHCMHLILSKNTHNLPTYHISKSQEQLISISMHVWAGWYFSGNHKNSQEILAGTPKSINKNKFWFIRITSCQFYHYHYFSSTQFHGSTINTWQLLNLSPSTYLMNGYVFCLFIFKRNKKLSYVEGWAIKFILSYFEI